MPKPERGERPPPGGTRPGGAIRRGRRPERAPGGARGGLSWLLAGLAAVVFSPVLLPAGLIWLAVKRPRLGLAVGLGLATLLLPGGVAIAFHTSFVGPYLFDSVIFALWLIYLVKVTARRRGMMLLAAGGFTGVLASISFLAGWANYSLLFFEMGAAALMAAGGVLLLALAPRQPAAI
jgi:hypothetical protein